MYASDATREDRRDVLVGAIRDIRFGAVVVTAADGLSASASAADQEVAAIMRGLAPAGS